MNEAIIKSIQRMKINRRGGVKVNIVAIRGAITVDANTHDSILKHTQEMLKAIIEKNNIGIEDIIQIHFTATKDLDSVYPAVAAREMGITSAALMCTQEMYVEGFLPMCIRVSVLTYSKFLTQKTVKHVYLGGAKILRTDLSGDEEDCQSQV